VERGSSVVKKLQTYNDLVPRGKGTVFVEISLNETRPDVVSRYDNEFRNFVS